MLVDAIVYAESLGLKGGVPEADLEASLFVGTLAVLLLVVLPVYRRLSE